MSYTAHADMSRWTDLETVQTAQILTVSRFESSDIWHGTSHAKKCYVFQWISPVMQSVQKRHGT